MTGGRHLHTRQALALLLREPRSKEKLPSGARVAQAHSDAGDSRSVYLVARANQERTMDNSTAHTSVDGLTVLEFPQRTSPLSRGFLGLKQ